MNMRITSHHPLAPLSPEQFPPLLREINDPPEQLFVRGALPPEDAKLLCVVGARKYTSYGKDVCEKLIAGLRGFPIVIVSGLALGIDSIAHRAALAAGLTTLAVPGSGLNPDVLYPSAHRGLAEEIVAQGGALVSEFEPDFRATPWSFPQRNRIMAGLSHAVLVVEAQQKSGTLITARLAAEYNRDVLVVPGSIFSENSAGPHMLLRIGATPITAAADILEALGFDRETDPSQRDQEIKSCSAEEKQVLQALTEPRTRDELCKILNVSARELNARISLLEIKGIIRESLGKIQRMLP